MQHPEAPCQSDNALPIESGERLQAILDHLSSGCVSCGAALQLLREAQADGRLEGQQEPPQYAVDSAKEAFVLREMNRTESGSTITLHDPVFDSSTRSAAREPEGAGLLNRQMTFHCVCHTISLRFAYELGDRGRLEVDGEILDRRQGPVEGVRVDLRSKGGPDATALSGDLGHFFISAGTVEEPCLSLQLGTRRLAEIDLVPLFRPPASNIFRSFCVSVISESTHLYSV